MQDDINRVSAQLQQNLDKQIRQDLQQQLQSQSGTQVSSTISSDASVNASPPIGTSSQTVTVTINGRQRKVAYFSNHDAQTLARLLLKQQAQQLGANYVLLNATIQLGQAAYEGIDNDNSGQVLIAIAAAGVAQYQFPAAQVHAIQNGLKGMKLSTANAFVKLQQGVDPTSVSIRVTSGNSIPSDPAQIRIFTINPANFPAFTLPPVTPVSTTGQ